MPHVVIQQFKGRSEDEKQALADAVAKAMVAAGVKDAAISIAIEEVEPSAWGGVYDRDIAPVMDKLYKKPGYERP
ncbi:hypothetical protein GCM10007301_03530 [Azorhizobium oxalatiphilum]|uniref:4-oxalocrotonate tautomerase-like domain-containing protein n=1 Tax=Azorhizobium oxalatiphilum TaxID=980631 RepID=A0A917BKE7_9HYPH|nr:tautomerase family protein [Azorhizobium oxalatiphilum]GGF47491.1 hypothetical protein GCM10007301_03530 [Azorhizobium oxalatiphilum]